jgi:hypothetical protein
MAFEPVFLSVSGIPVPVVHQRERRYDLALHRSLAHVAPDNRIMATG